MDLKAIVTYSGAIHLFSELRYQIAASIPQDTCEWRRSFERPIKNVRLDASFRPMDTHILNKYRLGKWSIIEHPVLHLFIIECNEIEAYKNGIKDDIENWLTVLKTYEISDWMIIVIDTLDVKKHKNILSRTTLLDKVRIDFSPKNGDRCISLLNPIKHETKATESFRCFLHQIRHFMLSGYNRNIIKYEELIRSKREKRNQDEWCFVKYFLLQEELAFVLEELGLFSEALVQYDELDAMFSQFIQNSTVGENYSWLQTFSRPLTTFNGISFDRKRNNETRKLILEQKASLLDFRRYVFERQCILLNAEGLHWEVADRLLPFLFSTLKEIKSLKIESCKGSYSTWEFLCALEVLNLCELVVDYNEGAKCYQYCAPILNLAKDKLYELGKLCGLIPGFKPTSEQLHIVVQLSFGIGDNHISYVENEKISTKCFKRNPNECLKHALGSNEAFHKLYLELCELAISTYKHVSRLRSARLVGLDLGNFYSLLNEPRKAIIFFTDFMRELNRENWNYLAGQILLGLANCNRKLDDVSSLIKTCSAITCCQDLEILVRTFYFDELLKTILKLEKSQKCVLVKLEDHFKIVQIYVKNETCILQDETLYVEIRLDSNFPREVLANRITLSFEKHLQSNDDIILEQRKLSITSHLDFKQDHNLNCASVVCNKKKDVPVRPASCTRQIVYDVISSDFSSSCIIENVVLNPGGNTILLKKKANRIGVWRCTQLDINIDIMHFLSDSLNKKCTSFEVITKPASAVLSFKNLIAGIEQSINLIVSGGSFIFSKDSRITLKCSKYLQVKQLEELQFGSETSIKLVDFQKFEERVIPLKLICDLPGRRENKSIEHRIILSCPWNRNELHIPIHFLPAMVTTCRLHSAGTKKFLQVLIKGRDPLLMLCNASMSCISDGVNIKSVDPPLQQKQIIHRNLSLSYLWEIEVEPLQAECVLPIIQVNFCIDYAHHEGREDKRSYFCRFDVTDYTTLFRIHAKVDQSELCRVGSVCHLSMRVVKLQENPFTELMYEVMADQHMWAVCGRSAGVISLRDLDNLTVLIEILPLTTGFLPLPSIRISKYISVKNNKDVHPKLQPFPPGQVYNATKSVQIQVLASNSID